MNPSIVVPMFLVHVVSAHTRVIPGLVCGRHSSVYSGIQAGCHSKYPLSGENLLSLDWFRELILFISFLLCCFKLFNHLHTINCDIWLLSTTTTSFLHWVISVLLLLKIFNLEQTFLLLQASKEVDDPDPRGRVL